MEATGAPPPRPASTLSTSDVTPAPPANSSLKTCQHIVKRHDDIVKSQEDKRHYRGLELSNQLKVLLVSDPSTDKSAASVDVNVGYLSDPDDIPGLAHFCEHMLFLGTEKYPKENEYNKFLSEHGGSSNAYTTADHTTYYFDVLPDHLPAALDIFAQFFIAPLFTESATERELNAVNSEHDKNRSSDTWRLDQINRSTADPQHVYSKFGTGNRETLETIPRSRGIDVRKALLDFHERWYSADIMALIVLGRESLDELESLVAPLFASVRARGVSAPSWPRSPYPPHLLRRRAFVVPVKELRSLSINMPVPDHTHLYTSAPGNYLSNLVGHEGPGSLLSALKKRGWCNSLVGGTRNSARGFAFFSVQVDLTEEGVNHIDSIAKLFFQYLELLRKEGPQRWLWEEQRDLFSMDFRFKDTDEPRSFVSGYANALQKYPMRDVLSYHYLVSEWREDYIQELLALLTPDNVRIGVVAKCFEDKCTETERWYGTKYYQEDISEETLKDWRTPGLCEELHLPLPNEFIPTRLDLAPREDSTQNHTPSIVRDTPKMRLWFKQDNEFLLPKAIISIDFHRQTYSTKIHPVALIRHLLITEENYHDVAYKVLVDRYKNKQLIGDKHLEAILGLPCFSSNPSGYLQSPLAYSEPLNVDLLTVWCLLLRDSLVEYTYAAELAGLRYHISNSKQGLSVTIDGHDDKQHVLLDKIMERMSTFQADPARFLIMKEAHGRTLRSLEAEQPYQHALYHQALMLSDHSWTRKQLEEAAPSMTVEQLDEFASRFMQRIHCEALIVGNMTRERALTLADIVENRLPKDGVPLLSQQLLLNREIELEKASHYMREVENAIHRSSCTLLYYACGRQETKQNVLLELLLHVMSEPCFNLLRTVEQLGYIVFSGMRRSHGMQGLRVIVQSDRLPDYVEDRVEAFLEHMEEYLTAMTDEEFLRHRAALAAERLEKPKQMSQRFGSMGAEISAQQYNFDRPRVEVDSLQSVTREELLQLYRKYIWHGSAERRKLSVHVVSTIAPTDEKKPADGLRPPPQRAVEPIRVTDLVEFKSRRALCPSATPYINIPRKGAHCKL